MTIFLKLLMAHWLFDYPLQGDFLAKAKNHKMPIPGVPWYQALIAHAGLQAGMVWLVTGSRLLGGIEFLMHALIDYRKSDGAITYNQDQFLHIACKAGYVLWLW